MSDSEAMLHPTVRWQARADRRAASTRVIPEVALVPLFCTACRRQVPGFADITSNRYGHLGTAGCPCGAVINGTAPETGAAEASFSVRPPGSDGFGDQVRFTYADAFALGDRSWTLLREGAGYDLHARHGHDRVELPQVLEEVLAGLPPEARAAMPVDTDQWAPFERMPPLIDRWRSLLAYLDGPPGGIQSDAAAGPDVMDS